MNNDNFGRICSMHIIFPLGSRAPKNALLRTISLPTSVISYMHRINMGEKSQKEEKLDITI